MPMVNPWAHIRAWTTFCAGDWYLVDERLEPCIANARLAERDLLIPPDEGTSSRYANSPGTEDNLVLVVRCPFLRSLTE